jgi:hypothetical protein
MRTLSTGGTGVASKHGRTKRDAGARFWLRAAAGALLAAAPATAPAQVELLSGVKRVDTPAAPAPAPKPPEPRRAEPVVPVAIPAPPPYIAPVKILPSASDPIPVVVPAPVVAREPVEPAQAKPSAVAKPTPVVPAAPVVPVVEIPAEPIGPPTTYEPAKAVVPAAHETLVLPSEPAALPALAPAVTVNLAKEAAAPVPADESLLGLARSALGSLVGTMGALVFALMVLIVALFGLMRRYGPLLRVEFVGEGLPRSAGRRLQAADDEAPLAEDEDPEAHVILPVPVQVFQEHPAQDILVEQFDLGPSYEEEQRILQEQAATAEQGLLRHVFELNMRLRDQIAALDGPAVEPSQELIHVG